VEEDKVEVKSVNKESKRGITIGIISALIASLCCVGPIIILLLGLSTVSFALSLSKYKLYFLLGGIAFATLAIAIYLRQRSKACSCSYKESIKREKKFLITTLAIIVSIYFLVTYVISPKAFSLLYPQKQISNEGSKNPTLNNLRFLTLKIDGMYCSGCAASIEYFLLNYVNGIINAKVYFPSGKGEITYDTTKISKEKIVEKINSEFPYKAYIINDTSI
jgi:mercuric ion transport protein